MSDGSDTNLQITREKESGFDLELNLSRMDYLITVTTDFAKLCVSFTWVAYEKIGMIQRTFRWLLRHDFSIIETS